MIDPIGRRKRHFILDGVTNPEKYSPPRPKIKRKEVPDRDRQRHGATLLSQIETLKPYVMAAGQLQREAGLKGGFGAQVEFESFPDTLLAFESLARDRSGIELLNFRRTDSQSYASVFVPEEKLLHFERIIIDYIMERRDKSGRPRDNKSLVNTIQQIRAASLRALWTDDVAVFPVSDTEKFWWEVWLPIRHDRIGTLITFRQMAEILGIRVAPGHLEFPERSVLLAYASAADFERSIMTLNSIAELRRAKETADFFDSLRPDEQPEWLHDLLSRMEFVGPLVSTPYICLLDTGVNNGHPAIAPALAQADLHTVEPVWGADDADGHGTEMAGVALIGNLADALASEGPVRVSHRLESVKLLLRGGANPGNPQLHGNLTIEAISRPEIGAPFRLRVFGMAVTTSDCRDRGRPSAWSAAVDGLASDASNDGETPRLLVLAAGNINDCNAWNLYPDSNSTDGIHDPGQAWNALTIGACTDLVRISEPGTDDYIPVAPVGGLSPFSTTSATWQPHWPMKPDIVFEGGNAAKDGLGAVTMHSLSLLTTYHKPKERLFTTTNATSAAMALASRMAAQVLVEYPALWPESVRALLVHSARWTDAMRDAYVTGCDGASKANYARLVRHCGFGVPDLERALWSLSNSLTMVIEEKLRPFKRAGGNVTLRDMHLHRLPWPLPELEALGNTRVEMRVTLSYFIEPNPSVRGFRSRYRYESHGLRFEVMRPTESEDEFRKRINRAARDEEEGTQTGGGDPDWLIGKQNRHRGSIHTDIWYGSAIELARRGIVAVYPTLGWWKTRSALGRYDKAARYTLVVSIHAPEIELDLYNAVATEISTSIETST